MAACFGRAASLEDFREAILSGTPLIGRRPDGRWKGCDAALPGWEGLPGGFLDTFALAAREFRIPPLEIPDILPQHLLMLKVAAAAMADAHLPLRAERPRMGALIGIDFDFEATKFHLPVSIKPAFPQWQCAHGPHLSEAQAAGWLQALQDACAPALTASRSLGALGRRYVMALRHLGLQPPAQPLPQVTISYLGETARIVALQLVENLHNRHIGAVLTPGDRSLKAQLKSADRLNAAYAVILGEDEVKVGQATVRTLSDSQQSQINLADLPDWLTARL